MIIENKDIINLLKSALKAQKFSYAPYSNFNVGAALLTKDNKIFTGCNIESASFSATVCAERTAFFKAISRGEKQFKAIAIVGSKNNSDIKNFCPPCGVCRQVMAEFCDEDFLIILFNGKNHKLFKLRELIPFTFDRSDMWEKGGAVRPLKRF